MSPTRRPRPDQPQVITEARWPMSADISYRQRRYLIMMGIRMVCFVIAVIVWLNHGGWLAAIPAAAAIVLPYFAVVFANGGREPAARRPGFQSYEPSLPERYTPPAEGQRPDGASASAGPAGQASTGNGQTPPGTPGNPA